MASIDKIMIDIQKFHIKVVELYNSDQSDIDKWLAIATQFHIDSGILMNLFDVLQEEKKVSQIKLNYQESINQIHKQLTDENDSIMKASLIILSLHQIVYQLATTYGNYYFSLNGKEEMIILKKKLNYYINISTKNEQNIFFHAFILLYGLESLFNKHFYVGIDFEFTFRQIQLSQLNFEHHDALQSLIYIISPKKLEPVMLSNFIQLIMCNKRIHKILHGSSALDIPYVYKEMLEDDSEKIISFTLAMIDTQYPCEYYKLNKEESLEYRCSIYDEEPSRSAVYYFGLISKEQQDNLTAILESLPVHNDREWNIHKMSKSQVLYAQYDVIFLKYFYYRMINVAAKDETSDLAKKRTIELYKNVIGQLTQFVYLENNNVTLLRNKCKEEGDVANNYFIKGKNKIVKLIDIFRSIFPGIVTNNPKVEIDKIIKVNLYKKSIEYIVKRMVYGILSQKYRIQMNKTNVWTDRLDNQFIFEFFRELHFDHLYLMFKDIEKILEHRIIALNF